MHACWMYLILSEYLILWKNGHISLLVAKQLSTSPQPCEKHSSCCYHLPSSRWTCTWSLPYRTEVFSSQASSGSWILHSHCCSSCAKSCLILYLTVILLQLTKMMFTFPIISSGSYSFQTSSAFPGGSLLHEKERCFYISTYATSNSSGVTQAPFYGRCVSLASCLANVCQSYFPAQIGSNQCHLVDLQFMRSLRTYWGCAAGYAGSSIAVTLHCRLFLVVRHLRYNKQPLRAALEMSIMLSFQFLIDTMLPPVYNTSFDVATTSVWKYETTFPYLLTFSLRGQWDYLSHIHKNTPREAPDAVVVVVGVVGGPVYVVVVVVVVVCGGSCSTEGCRRRMHSFLA